MKKSIFLTLSAAVLLFTLARPAPAQDFNLQLNITMLNMLTPPTTTDPPGNFQHVIPSDFDPGKTYLVQATWLSGAGCTTSGFIQDFPTGTTPYMDSACPIGDDNDKRNMGLLLVKTGPTPNFAAAVAELTNVKGISPLTELGYDIRKSGGSASSPLGSHCGAGAPRFDVVTND